MTLEYAYEQGAAIGGATGAGGEAPKLLMTEDKNGHLYPDAVLADERACRHWFIKFARQQALADDQEILRAEYLYYRALQQLGIETVASEQTKWPALIERAGEIDWQAACVALAEFIDPDEAYQRLRQEARHLLALPNILSGLGLPEVVMNHPAIALGKLERRMAEWGLA